MSEIPFGSAWRTWARVAAQSFGGPAGQIAVLHRIVVDEKQWLDERTFLRALGFCMMLPGPEAQQLATFVGWKLHGVRGGLVAGLLFILPGFLSILALSILYVTLGDTPLVEAVFYGLTPAVLAIVFEALLRLRRRALDGVASLAIAAASFIAVFLLGVPFPLVIIGAAVFGAIHAHTGMALAEAAEVATSHPARSTLIAGAVSVLLWFVLLIVLHTTLPADHALVSVGDFFSRSAVMTFGGAYGVLTYVAQQAVDVRGWLTPTEMLHGLGLAETTPGPLIMVVQFVGFVAAFRNPGGFDPMTAGILGSLVTTFVTFAPCFFFIFTAAPFLESLMQRRWLEGAMRGITAAVVGVVLNLAVWFSMHTLFGVTRSIDAAPLRFDWPVWDSLDPGAAVIAAAAAVLALRLRAGMFTVLGFGVLAGLVLRSF